MYISGNSSKNTNEYYSYLLSFPNSSPKVKIGRAFQFFSKFEIPVRRNSETSFSSREFARNREPVITARGLSMPDATAPAIRASGVALPRLREQRATKACAARYYCAIAWSVPC